MKTLEEHMAVWRDGGRPLLYLGQFEGWAFWKTTNIVNTESFNHLEIIIGWGVYEFAGYESAGTNSYASQDYNLNRFLEKIEKLPSPICRVAMRKPISDISRHMAKRDGDILPVEKTHNYTEPIDHTNFEAALLDFDLRIQMQGRRWRRGRLNAIMEVYA